MTASAPTAIHVVSGSAFYRTFLDHGGWSNRPGISGRLKAKGRRTWAMETTALRIPAWATSATAELTLGLDEQGASVYGYPVVVAGNARAKDLPLLIALASRFILNGCPEDCMVEWTLEEGAEWLSYAHYGGREAKRVRQAIKRLMTVVLENVAIRLDGGEPTPLDHNYHFVEDAWISKQGKGASWVRLHPSFAQLLRMGIVTFLDHPTISELQRKDEVALRIWLFLESETGPTRAAGWTYPVFPVPGASMPSISQLAWLSGNRQYIVRRIRQAIAVLCEADDRYEITVDRRARMHVIKMDEVVQSSESKTDESIQSRRTRASNQDGRDSTKSRSLNVVRTSDKTSSESFVASLRALTGDEPIYAALSFHGWKHRSSKQVRFVIEVANQRGLGTIHEVATIIVMDFPGRPTNLIEWLKTWKRPPRPIYVEPDDPPPPPLTPEERAAQEESIAAVKARFGRSAA